MYQRVRWVIFACLKEIGQAFLRVLQRPLSEKEHPSEIRFVAILADLAG